MSHLGRKDPAGIIPADGVIILLKQLKLMKISSRDEGGDGNN